MTKDVFTNQAGIVEAHPTGELTEETVHHLAKRINEELATCRRDGRPAVVLDVLLQMTDISVPARQLMVEYFKDMDFDKLAILGTGTFYRLGANLVIQAVGKETAMEYFDDHDKAVKWLLSK